MAIVSRLLFEGDGVRVVTARSEPGGGSAGGWCGFITCPGCHHVEGEVASEGAGGAGEVGGCNTPQC